MYLTETEKVPRAKLYDITDKLSTVDSTKGLLLLHTDSLQSSPKSIPFTILSASDISVAVSEDNSVLLESFVTASYTNQKHFITRIQNRPTY